MPQSGTDYLAVINVSGAGSWARDPDREKAINSVIRLFRRDFINYYKLKKGMKVAIDVLNVTGHDKVWWDDCNFYTKNDEPFNGPVERIQRTL